jgi:hypothetical protein
MSKRQAKLRVQHHEEEYLVLVVVGRLIPKWKDEIEGTLTITRGLN